MTEKVQTWREEGRGELAETVSELGSVQERETLKENEHAQQRNPC